MTGRSIGAIGDFTGSAAAVGHLSRTCWAGHGRRRDRGGGGYDDNGELAKPAPAAYVCPPTAAVDKAGRNQSPLQRGRWHVLSRPYPGEGSAYEVTFDPGDEGCSGEVRRRGHRAAQPFRRTGPRQELAKQVTQDILTSKFPGAVIHYEIPNAWVTEPGYGVIADLYPRDTSSIFRRLRVIVIAAVKHDYALIATAAGVSRVQPGLRNRAPSGPTSKWPWTREVRQRASGGSGDRYGRPS